MTSHELDNLLTLAQTRRHFFRTCGVGLGSVALASLLNRDAQAAPSKNPLAPRKPHHPAKAKSVIFLFMAGGPSHLETFDPKPLLNELHGQSRPAAFGEAKYQFINRDSKILGTQRTFKQYGDSGIAVSDLFPHTAKVVDDLAVTERLATSAADSLYAAYRMARLGIVVMELCRPIPFRDAEVPGVTSMVANVLRRNSDASAPKQVAAGS